MKKILIVSTVSRQFYLFEQGNIEVLKSLGYDVHGAANFSDENERLNELEITRHHFDIQRKPFSVENIKAYYQLKKILREGYFDVIHCHSPMGGVLARLAAKAVGNISVIYTAHGFHFYKGAPKRNWFIYYLIEKYLSKFTDILITINKEDYEQSLSFKAKRAIFIPGIGIDTERFRNISVDQEEKRKHLQVPKDMIVILSIGEMIKRKNHATVLKALTKVNNRNFIYLICGSGELEEHLRDISLKLGIIDKVRFLGFRNDIPDICGLSDIFIFPSYQEGLPVAAMEAMSAGLPVICSSIRGNTDLIIDGYGGFLHDANDVDGFAQSIDLLIKNSELRKVMGQRNLIAVKKYDKKIVKKRMEEIYSSFLSK